MRIIKQKFMLCTIFTQRNTQKSNIWKDNKPVFFFPEEIV